MLDCFTSLTHFLRMLIKAPLHSFENVLVFPSRDQPLLAGDALMLDGATLACVGPIAAQNQAAGIALGTPPMLLGLLLAFSSSLNMSLTHYATGTAPIIFGSGYTTLNEWWVAGPVMSAVNLLLLVLVGSIWWTMLGYIANG